MVMSESTAPTTPHHTTLDTQEDKQDTLALPMSHFLDLTHPLSCTTHSPKNTQTRSERGPSAHDDARPTKSPPPLLLIRPRATNERLLW